MTRALALVLATALSPLIAGCESSVQLSPSARPERLYAVSNSAGVLLYWDAVPGASGYRVYRREVGETEFELDQERPTGFAFVGFATDGMHLAVSALRGNDESRRSPEILGVRQPEHVSPNYVLAVTSTAEGFASAIESAGDVDGDGYEDVLVGAPMPSGGTGALYLFHGAASGLDPIPRLIATGTSGSLFGASIAYSETFVSDSPVAVVGAPGGTGGAHLFSLLGGALPFSLSSPLAPPAGAVGAGFGTVVVDAGNLDGLVPVSAELAVSAPYAAGGEGRVYVYQGGAADAMGAPLEVSLATPTAGSLLGFSLAAAGNLETDPEDDLLIGAPGHAGIGAVAVLSGDIAMFQASAATAALTAVGSGLDSLFGWSVTSIGDSDSDDRDEYVVGAPNDDCDRGEQAKGSLMVVNPGAGDGYAITCGQPGERLGSALGFAGSVFNDEEQFLVGSYSTDGSGQFSLAHWRLEPESTSENQLERFQQGGFVGTGFGRVLAAADVNGDGRPDVLAGTPETASMYLFVTIPENGPEVLLGGPLDAVEGQPVSFAAAFVNDTVETAYSCTVVWGDASPAVTVDPCTSESLRELSNPYVITDPESDGHEDFFPTVDVFTADGRSGTAVTRIRVRPAS